LTYSKYDRLRELRLENHLSQKEVAEHLNIRQNTYSKIECGRAALKIPNAIKLAFLYQTSLDYLSGLTDERKPHKRCK
jgi:transcriptional regulator with XRE-family HTH domain